MNSRLLLSTLRSISSTHRPVNLRSLPQPRLSLNLVNAPSLYRTIVSSSSNHRQNNESNKPTTAAATFTNVIELIKFNTSSINSIYTRICNSPHGRLMRLDKPIGTNLLFLPAAWTITLGASNVTDWLSLTCLFYSGSILLRGAGCTINDLWDIDIDRQVERTKSRPLASGEITQQSAIALLVGQLSGGLLILTQLHANCFPIATISLLPIFFYPLAKRTFTYPQFVLGLTFNASTLIGYAAATGGTELAAFGSHLCHPAMIYLAACSWTVVYDTIYAFQDIKDDQKLAIHSTAIAFGNNPKFTLSVLALAKYSLLTVVGLYSPQLSMWPYLTGLSASALHLSKLIVQTDLKDEKQCQHAFNQSAMTGALTWGAFILGRLL